MYGTFSLSLCVRVCVCRHYAFLWVGVQVTGYQPPKPCVSFAHFGFSEDLMSVIRKSEFSTPTPIQAQVREREREREKEEGGGGERKKTEDAF